MTDQCPCPFCGRTRPPKMKISVIGKFEDGKPVGWVFDGRGVEDTVGLYVAPEVILYGGYTVQELSEIAQGRGSPRR